MAQQLKIDPEAVRSLAELLRETDLTEIEYQLDSLRIKVSRTALTTVVPAPVPVSEYALNQNTQNVVNGTPQPTSTSPTNNLIKLEDHPGVIEAQMVGTVYLSPGPEAKPFINVGEEVTQGQTIFIIEAMKVMNMIKAPRSGIVRHVFVKDAQPVEYGDPILIIE